MELVQWCLPNSSPIFLYFAYYNIHEMSLDQSQNSSFVENCMFFTYWDFKDIVALILKFMNEFCVCFLNRKMEIVTCSIFFMMVSSGMVYQHIYF